MSRCHAKAVATKTTQGSHTHSASLDRTESPSFDTSARIPIGDTRIGRTGRK